VNRNLQTPRIAWQELCTAKTMTGSYTAAFTMAGVLCLISAGLAIVLKRLADPPKAEI